MENWYDTYQKQEKQQEAEMNQMLSMLMNSNIQREDIDIKKRKVTQDEKFRNRELELKEKAFLQSLMAEQNAPVKPDIYTETLAKKEAQLMADEIAKENPNEVHAKLDEIKQIGKLVKDFNTGGFGGSVKGYLAKNNIVGDQATANRLEAFFGEQIRGAAKDLRGSLSEKELSFIQDSQMGLNKAVDANLQLLNLLEKGYKNKLDYTKFRNDYHKQNGTLKGVKLAWSDIINSREDSEVGSARANLDDTEEKKNNESSLNKDPNGPESVWEQNDTTNKKQLKWNPVWEEEGDAFDNTKKRLKKGNITAAPGFVQPFLDIGYGVAGKKAPQLVDKKDRDLAYTLGDLAGYLPIFGGAAKGLGQLGIKGAIKQGAIGGAAIGSAINPTDRSSGVIAGGAGGLLGGAVGSAIGVGGKKIVDIYKKLNTPEVQSKLANLGSSKVDIGALINSPSLNKIHESVSNVPLTGGTKGLEEVVKKSNKMGESFIEDLVGTTDRTIKPKELLSGRIKGKYDEAYKPFKPRYEELFREANIEGFKIPSEKLPSEVKNVLKYLEIEKKPNYTLEDLHIARSQLSSILRNSERNPSKDMKQLLDIKKLKGAKKEIDALFGEEALPEGIASKYSAITKAFKEEVTPYRTLESAKVATGKKEYENLLPDKLLKGESKEINQLFGKLGQEEKNLITLNKLFNEASPDAGISNSAILSKLGKLSSKEKDKVLTKKQQKSLKELMNLESVAQIYRPRINRPQTGAKLYDAIGKSSPWAVGGAGLALGGGAGAAAGALGTIGASRTVRSLLENPQLWANPTANKFGKLLLKSPKYAGALGSRAGTEIAR